VCVGGGGGGGKHPTERAAAGDCSTSLSSDV